MNYIEKRRKPSETPSIAILPILVLGMAVFGSQPSLADQVDCEKVRTGTEPIRFTVLNTNEMQGKPASEKVAYVDVIRSDPAENILIAYPDGMKIKSTYSKSLLQLSYEIVGKSSPQTITYDADISGFSIKAGSTLTVNSIDTPVAGISTFGHHEYSILEGGSFQVSGCSFPVVSVHHTIHYKRNDKEWDVTIDSLVSPDLAFVLRARREIVADANFPGVGVLVSVVTDLTSSADMTKAP